MKRRHICFVVPWFRSLGQLYGRALVDAGHDVTVVTTARHFESGYGLVPEIVLPAKHTARPRWRDLRSAYESVRTADLCLIEETSAPLFWALTQIARRRVIMVHDARPHDWVSAYSCRQQMMRRRQYASSSAVVYFSQAVADALEPGRRSVVLPLLSEMPDEWRPAQPASPRRDFAFVGRLYPYKNLHAVQKVAEEVLKDASEKLLIFGDGPVAPLKLATSRVMRRTFTFADVAPLVANCRALVMPYGAGSQSGVQIFAMQCGTVPIISDLPGLLEYGLPGQPVVRRDLLEEDLHAWMYRLLDDEVAQSLAETTGKAYEQRFSQAGNARIIAESIEALLAR